MSKIVQISLVIAMVLTCGNGRSQVVYPFNENDEVEISEVVQTSLSKGNVYKNAREWALNQVGQVIMQDDENCKLIMDCRFQYQKGSYLALWPNSPQTHHFVRDDINYRVTIECKDGRYRIKITNIKLNYVRKLHGGFEMDYPIFINKNNTQNEWMEYAKSELVKIEATDTTKMKKKELYDYKVRLCAAKESVELYTHLNQFEYDYLFGKINSIKKALEKDDDF